MVQYFPTVENSQLKHDTKSEYFLNTINIFLGKQFHKLFPLKIQQGLRDNIVHISHIFPINLSVKVCNMTTLTAVTGVHVSGTGRMRLWALVHSTESCSVVFQRPPPGETGNMRTGGGCRTKALCSWPNQDTSKGKGYQCRLAIREFSTHSWKVSGSLC